MGSKDFAKLYVDDEKTIKKQTQEINNLKQSNHGPTKEFWHYAGIAVVLVGIGIMLWTI